jgi:two-component system chemotaxis sensor kinase CheA
VDLTQYLDLFLAEAREHLESLSEHLLRLEKDPENKEIVKEIFRSAHTLKGMAATMGFEQITEVTHEMENALSLLKEGKIRVTPEVIDVLLRCVDLLEVMVRDLKEGKSESRFFQDLLEELQQLSSFAVESPQEVSSTIPSGLEFNEYDVSVIQAAEESGYKAYYLKIGLAPGTVMKSVRAFMVFHNLEEIGQIVKCYPSAQDLEEERFEDEFEVVLLTQVSRERVSEVIGKISEVRVLALEELKSSELISKPELKKEVSQEPTKDSFRDFSGLRTLRTVRVDIERLDNLMNLVGELVINKTRLEQIGVTHRISELVEAVEQMGRLTSDLQSIVMKVRMVPVEHVFNRFPRMVRDLAREMGKEVEFVVEGKETELDRTVIDEIGEPLVHLLRNALDHGIETPEERIKKGKPPVGLLRLEARHEGNNVVIEVEDDGRGIDVEKVRKKAIAMGLLSEKEKEESYLDEKALLNLIFQPGFSTADEVTDVSGRGVGMDVVKSKIESLNGTIEIETRKDLGTKVKVTLPLTLAIIQALLVNVGSEQYAIPLSSIDETTSVTPDQIKTVQNKEVMFLRGMVLPLVRLHDLLAVEDVPENEEMYVVVARKGERQVGLVVDSLAGQQEIVIKSLGKFLEGIPGIAGATILGNGQVALIIDVNSLF